MYPKIKLTARNWSDLRSFYIDFAEFELLMFHNNIVRLSEEKKMNNGKLLKICLQVTYLQISAYMQFAFFFTIWMEKKKTKKKKKNNDNFLCVGSYDKQNHLNHDKSLQITANIRRIIDQSNWVSWVA